MGTELHVNGVPMRIRGFVSERPASELAAWFRARLGPPLVERQVGGKLLLGRGSGEHYLTVQLEPLGVGGADGTRALVAAGHLKAAEAARDESKVEVEHWQSRMPAGSRLMNQVKADDGARLSSHLTFFNRHALQVNVDRVKALMQEDGLAFERDTQTEEGAQGSATPEGRVLYFKGAGKEAMAVVVRSPERQTMVVLSVVRSMEHFK
ncbi:hypothetical protein AAW51_4979 [Caldimonas brevitalea]|uniref:Uncharacterized protein n=1 Tax=Caldimonas brevitalea TaxID=413882 RepID=A0A0G3BYR5_9BURK|nr:hypothetical protein AAW51_4979 [Caldimonas brevitalea]